MATLTADSGWSAGALTVWPHAILEEGSPSIVTVRLRIQHGESKPRLDLALSMSDGDLREIAEAARRIASDVTNRAVINTLDGDCIVGFGESSSSTHVYVAVWLGEPHELLHGYRLTVSRHALVRFSVDLAAELTALSRRL